MKKTLITGANSGIGLETARYLAGSGQHVFLACRNQERACEAEADILESYPQAKLTIINLDLACFDSILNAAKQLRQHTDCLDVLINNAGVAPATKQKTANGYELQFGVNYLGHFLLTHSLLPLLNNSLAARVINVSSVMHRFGSIDFSSFKAQKPYFVLKAYAQSKLANILFSKQLAKLYKKQQISSYSLHPGEVSTNIAGKSLFRRTAYRLLGAHMSPKSGAKTNIYLATARDIEQLSGKYFNKHAKAIAPSNLARDSQLAAKLWQHSEQLIADSLKSKFKFGQIN